MQNQKLLEEIRKKLNEAYNNYVDINTMGNPGHWIARKITAWEIYVGWREVYMMEYSKFSGSLYRPIDNISKYVEMVRQIH